MQRPCRTMCGNLARWNCEEPANWDGMPCSAACLPEWSAIHHESVGLCLAVQSLTAHEIAHTLTAAGTFFAESMAPFEAHRCEFRRSNTALRYQNGKLEDQVTRVSRVVFDEAMQLVAAAGLALDRANGKLAAGQGGNLDAVQSLLDRIR